MDELDELDVDEEPDFCVLEELDVDVPVFVDATAVSSAKKLSRAAIIASRLSHAVKVNDNTAAAKRANIFLFLFMIYLPLVFYGSGTPVYYFAFVV